jgi:hypothetical protein
MNIEIVSTQIRIENEEA